MRSHLVLVLLVVAGCGEPTPGTPVEDPEAYLRPRLVEAIEAPRTGTPSYLLDDPAYIDSVITAAVGRSRDVSGDALPSDSRQLDRIVQDAARTYRTYLLATPKRRAAVEALIREQFEGSPIELRGTTAVTDLGSTPGRFERGMRTGWDLSGSPEIATGVLRPDVVAAVLGRMQEAEPSARAYLFTVKVPYGTSIQRVRYYYAPTEDYLRMQIGGKEYVSEQPINGLEGLAALETPRHYLDLFDQICASEADEGCADVWNP